MQHLFLSAFVALAATTASALPGSFNTPSPATLLTQDYQNAVTCGQKNPAVNMAIQAYCEQKTASGAFADNLTIGSKFAKDGMVHDGFKVNIVQSGVWSGYRPTCPKNDLWVPMEYCNAQFHYLCAVIGNKNGVGNWEWGTGSCQTWQIQNVQSQLEGFGG